MEEARKQVRLSIRPHYKTTPVTSTHPIFDYLQVIQEMTKLKYDCETFMLALIIPISCQLREHSTFLFLKSKFPNLYKNCPYAPRLGLKETWRFYSCPAISQLIDKKPDSRSELIIQITFSYVGDGKDYHNMWVFIFVVIGVDPKPRGGRDY